MTQQEFIIWATQEYNASLLEGEPPMTADEMAEIEGVLDGVGVIRFGHEVKDTDTCLMHKG